MSEIITLSENTPAIISLCQKDARFKKMYSLVGAITYKPHDDGYVFLISQIISQMLSNKVARVIFSRLLELCDGHISPDSICALSDEQLKSIGTSKSKVMYIRNLTSAITTGTLNFEEMKHLSDDDVLKKLTSIKGIGTWSAKMYLIFSLDRQDVLPYEDAAFQQGYGWAYKTNDFSKTAIEKKCKKWKPYSSIAARYMYKALDMGFTKEEFHLFK